MQNTNNVIIKELQQLKKRNRLQALVILIIAVFNFYSFSEKKDPILRAKGIVIVDDNGRDRILIGAPFPQSKDRIRTDFEKSKAAWADRFGGNFDWYKTNKTITHEGVGMLILDEKGHDRVSVGAPNPSAWIGRIAPGSGITINDDEGNERGGFGLLQNEKINRMTLGMDHISGYEGLTLGILEDGSTSINLNDTLGKNKISIVNDLGILSQWYTYPKYMSGLSIVDAKKKTKVLLNGHPDQPVFLLKDTAQRK